MFHAAQGVPMNTATLAAGSGGLSGWLAATAAALRDGLRRHALLYGFALFVLACATIESFWLGVPFDFTMVIIFTTPVLLVLTVMVIVALNLEAVRLWQSGYQGSLFAGLARYARDSLLAPERVANAIHITLFMTIYMVGYTFMKKAIPTMHPFAWDQTFMAWDALIHFGRQPYEWLQPVLGHPLITAALNVNYNLWFAAMFTCWFWQGYARKDSALRQHFLLAYTLTWFIGTDILGTIFSSVGPCFYGRLLPGADPYAPLMAYLTEANTLYPIFSLATQDALWRSYETGVGIINGISAMPSMHIGTSTLFALLGFASGKRWLGWLFTIFAMLIFIGAIHLAWHYAIDLYLGIAVALACWWIAGRLVVWDRRRQGLPT